MHQSKTPVFRSWALVLLIAIAGISCGGNDPSLEGTYQGNLAMEDGTKIVRLKLMKDKVAQLSGLY
ncbi:uncharacterized protein METZ01_LOCUS496591, partial [marine metagenome]